MSGLLREGRAGSNTTEDHITVLDQALTQIPDAHRHGTDNYPQGTRFIVRRERPHPGAQLSLFDTIEGMRHRAGGSCVSQPSLANHDRRSSTRLVVAECETP